jgi:hypothetical protein
MSLADAFGVDARYDPVQGVEDLARQVFHGDVQESRAVEPGRWSDALAARMDRKTRHFDQSPTEVKPPSPYGEWAITDSKPSSVDEVVKPRGLAIVDQFWNVATTSTALCFDAVVLLAALVVGDFPFVKHLLVVGPYVPVARLIAIHAFGLVAVLVRVLHSDQRKSVKNQKSQKGAQTEDAANCDAPLVLRAYGEQDAETPHTCSLAGQLCRPEKRSLT